MGSELIFLTTTPPLLNESGVIFHFNLGLELINYFLLLPLLSLTKIQNKGNEKNLINKKESEIQTTLYIYKQRKYKVVKTKQTKKQEKNKS